MTTDPALLAEYVEKIKPLLDLAKRAYGSRNTVSPEHDASREYTRLLCEYVEKRGSLLDIAAALEVTYAGLRRRVTTSKLPPAPRRQRMNFTDDVYDRAVDDIKLAKVSENTQHYHRTIKRYYDAGLSLARIAKLLGMSSANPLYFGVNRIALEDQE